MEEDLANFFGAVRSFVAGRESGEVVRLIEVGGCGGPAAIHDSKNFAAGCRAKISLR